VTQVVQKTEQGTIPDDDEIYLIDIIQFLRRNVKLLLLLTVGLSVMAIPLSLRQPKQYQKQITLSVKPARVPVDVFPQIDLYQANTLAVGFLQDFKVGQAPVKPTYDAVTQQISMDLQSLDGRALDDAASTVVNRLETGFGKIMGQAVENSLTATEIELKKKQRVLELLEQQKAQFSPSNEYRLGMVESSRIQPLADIAQLELEKQFLEDAQKNIDDFTQRYLSIQILAELEIPQPTRSVLPVIVFSAIASFIVAVFAALIREQILRLRDELSRNKIDSSQNV
jgi:hypothetical protein